MIRVLLVDDTATARQLLAHILTSDGQFEVVGEAVDGLQAIAMTKELQPDLILMDIHMPRMDGFEATKEIMIEKPTPIVIVSASTMVHEVEVGMQALRAGALTLLLKPPGPHAPDFEAAAKELIDTAKVMSEVKVVRRLRLKKHPDVAPVPTAAPVTVRRAARVQVCAIASSTGGPPALQTLLSGLPADFPVPVLVVQHIAAGFAAGFAAWLNSAVPLHVKLAENREFARPGTVYLAPEDRHLGLTSSGRIQVSDGAPTDGFRPSGTFLFRSVARACGNQVLAAILTGMGRDGVEGLRDVRQAGGTILAQDEASCVVFGMPGAAVAEGLADRVLPLDAMPKVLLQLVAGDHREQAHP